MGLIQIATFFFLFFQIKIQIIECQQIDKIYPGFQASQQEFNHNNGVFLISKTSIFSLGFYNGVDINLYSLGIIHILSSRVVWTANPDSTVDSSSLFVFDQTGNVYLQGSNPIWSIETKGENVSSLQLLDSGNLVLQSQNGSFIWQSFHYPVDTLLPGQVLWEGMKLKSYPDENNLSYYLQIRQGDLILYAGFQNPQIYWSLSNERRKIEKSSGGYLQFAILVTNSWNFYDSIGDLLRQFVFFWQSNWNDRWVAVLNSDGSISFINLEMGESAPPEPIRIPEGFCSVPQPCDRYFVCYFDNRCQCPSILIDKFDCRISRQMVSSIPCNGGSPELLRLGDNLDYFALSFSVPSLYSDLESCKSVCLGNCSCNALFFENVTGKCFLFDEVGSLRRSEGNSGGYISYIKTMITDGGDGSSAATPSPSSTPLPTSTVNRRKHITIMSILLAGMSLSFIGFFIFSCYRRKMEELLNALESTTEEDCFLNKISGTPIRFSYRQLRRATKNFSRKIGHGGFGSIYMGELPDGTRLAVKKLERIGQGVREFGAEISLMGSSHHVNLVKLIGICSESHHRVLVYEYMSNGSLDKWIFKNDEEEEEEGSFLDWDTRFNIALGTAKALAYLHEECEMKIIHCDIKPENILLDENFTPKVSDFGLAKLINREQQSFIFTQLRGTRGYVAPEWITNLSISDKSDVFSYGMVLLEIIGGRKNYDAKQLPEKTNFPSYAFKKMEEKKVGEIIDPRLRMVVREDADEMTIRVETAIEVALWCIQEEVNMRPPMKKVVQMMEGDFKVPNPLLQLDSSFSWSSGRD